MKIPHLPLITNKPKHDYRQMSTNLIYSIHVVEISNYSFCAAHDYLSWFLGKTSTKAYKVRRLNKYTISICWIESISNCTIIDLYQIRSFYHFSFKMTPMLQNRWFNFQVIPKASLPTAVLFFIFLREKNNAMNSMQLNIFLIMPMNEICFIWHWNDWTLFVRFSND